MKRSTKVLIGFLAVIFLCLFLIIARGIWHNRGLETITVDGLERGYFIHVPESYDGSQAVPLLLALHGGGGDGRNMDRLTGLNELADQKNLIVVYPVGYEKSWADYRGISKASLAGVDDVAYIRALIDSLSDTYNIDGVYGFFAQMLACDLSEQIDGIAVVAATTPANLPDQCNPSRPIPVLFIFGTDDPLVPVEGGQVMDNRGEVLSLGESAKLWADLNGCDPTPAITDLPDTNEDGMTVSYELYGSCSQDASVGVYIIEGGGHTWPGGWQYLPERWIGKTSRDVDANMLIWTHFFDMVVE